MLSRMQRINSRKANSEAKKHRSAKISKWVVTAAYSFTSICAYYACIRLILNLCDDPLSMFGTAASANFLLFATLKNIDRPYISFLPSDKDEP